MARHVNKMMTLPIDIIEAGEALAERYTGGNFSMLVRWLIAVANGSATIQRLLATMMAGSEMVKAEEE